MTFDQALLKVAQGGRATRAAWNNRTMYIALWLTVGGQTVIGMPFTVDGEGKPWGLAGEDLGADDWLVLDA